MSTATTTSNTRTNVEQLSLLVTAPPARSTLPVQFRLDERTRRNGLRHVAELRAQLAAQAAARNGDRVGLGSRRRSVSSSTQQAA